MPTIDELKMLQALPLDIKIGKTKQRIREWVDYYGEDGVCVSFSGGAYDSDGLWKPTKKGLGMKHVFDTLNELYGKDFIRY